MLKVLFLFASALILSPSTAAVLRPDISNKTLTDTTSINREWLGQTNHNEYQFCYKFVRQIYTDHSNVCFEYQPDCVDLYKFPNMTGSTAITDADCLNQTIFETYANVRYQVVLQNYQNSLKEVTTATTTPSMDTTTSAGHTDSDMLMKLPIYLVGLVYSVRNFV